MSTITNPELKIRFLNEPCTTECPANMRVHIFARGGGFIGFATRQMSDIPPECKVMNEDEFLAHPWTAGLIREAKDNLRERFAEALREAS